MKEGAKAKEKIYIKFPFLNRLCWNVFSTLYPFVVRLAKVYTEGSAKPKAGHYIIKCILYFLNFIFKEAEISKHRHNKFEV